MTTTFWTEALAKPASNPEAAQKSGVINPYALAEQVVGRKIDWKRVEDKARLLEDILQTPYSELFDPKFRGPLYFGLQLNERMQLERVREPLLDVEVRVDVNDLEVPLDADLTSIRSMKELGIAFHQDDIANLEVKRIAFDGPRYVTITIAVPERDRLQRLAHVFNRDLLDMVTYDPNRNYREGWTPPGATWRDAGDFFEEAAEFFDPIQGAVANCYYIAALSAVAWALPNRIQHMTRATGVAQQRFTNRIDFFKPDTRTIDRSIEVTDSVPLNGSGNFIYCRSSELGEIWPAVYEKAFAKLETGVSNDQPDITATGWGDCVYATSQLVGGQRFYYDNASRTGDQLWDIVRGNSLSYRTFNPMTAWTYSSGDAAPKKVVYADGNIVASHCYTVLGWAYRNGTKYIVLRNPWGSTEATVGALNGQVDFYDISWWRPINLATIDGTFAMEASAFKTHFAGVGVVK